MADVIEMGDVVNLADRRPRPMLAVVPPAPKPVTLADCISTTFGQLFDDLAYQLRKGELEQVMHRLGELAEDYGDVPIPKRP